MPVNGLDPAAVIDELTTAIEPCLVASAGPRYFGFVTGGSLDAATAADLLAVGWDQNAFNLVSSPAAALVEEVAGAWLKDVLGLPAPASVGFATGGQGANTVGLAAGRHAVLAQAGWDVERDGLIGAPPVQVLGSEERHATIDRSLRLLGLGTAAIAAAHRRDAWVHVDGAFGLWAAASPTTRALVDGMEAADSWACDAHKWL